MVELKTAEHLVHYMRMNISLSRFDAKFLDNLQQLPKVTSNQIALFNRLVNKYRRQLTKKGLFIDAMLALPWTTPVVESTTDYTNGHIKIEGDEIRFKCPFNRGFVAAFKDQTDNIFVWDRAEKEYRAKYGIYSLKILIDIASKFFETIHYCDTTKGILDHINTYRGTSWNPTLFNINNNLIISSYNEGLASALSNLDWHNDLHTVSRIVAAGVSVDSSVFGTDEKMKFFSSFQNTIEINQVLNIIPWLKEVGCDMVYLSMTYRPGSSSMYIPMTGIEDSLKEFGIPVAYTGYFGPTKLPATFNYPVQIKFKRSIDSELEPYKVSKVIQLVNSEPITIQ